MVDEKLPAADKFWHEARERVLRIAGREGFDITLAEHDDGFLFDLFDNGEYEPTDKEIVEAIKEYQEA